MIPILVSAAAPAAVSKPAKNSPLLIFIVIRPSVHLRERIVFSISSAAASAFFS